MKAMIQAKFLFVILIGVALVVVGTAGLLSHLPPGPGPIPEPSAQLNKFSSASEIKEYIRSSASSSPLSFGGFGFGGTADVQTLGAPQFATATAEAGARSSAPAKEYSTTNIQVAGVDEADIVKNDGKYIYSVSGKKILIVDAFPAEGASIASEINLNLENGQISEIFINGDKLVIFANTFETPPETQPANPTEPAAARIAAPYYYPYNEKLLIKVYDISDHTTPKVVKDIAVDGTYYDSRMIGNDVYVISHSPVQVGQDVVYPSVVSSGREISPTVPDVYYFPQYDYGYQFTSILSLNIQSVEEPQSTIYLTGQAQSLYVSADNIYMTYQKTLSPLEMQDRLFEGVVKPVFPSSVVSQIDQIRSENTPEPEKSQKLSRVLQDYQNSLPPSEQQQVQQRLSQQYQDFIVSIAPEIQKTLIHRLSINNGNVEYKATGEVPGTVLNQFSMDEFDGHFRIATTTFPQWFGKAEAQKNNVYVLNMDMKVVGKLEGLAAGEKIYSARFIGKRLYLVTFIQLDPLFVIDLSDPANPKVLGELKIPGVSDYLHPYDENHIIGIGRDAIGVDEFGRQFALFQGLKLALFDVSDVSNPKEVASTHIGDRGTDSEALHDHKAFLFDKQRNLLVLPVLLAEVNLSQNIDPQFAYGQQVWQGAYVFELTPSDGFVLKGRVTHLEDPADLQKIGYWYGFTPVAVKRTLFMDNVLYTVSDKMIKMNDLSSLEELNKVQLPYEGPENVPILWEGGPVAIR